jgi:hypothetical protein
VSLGATLSASFLVTLVRPATWLLALAAFLLRGGIILVLAPIVVIPSAVGLANVIAPTLTSFVFGGVSAAFILLVAGIATTVLLWLVVGGFLAAAVEVEAVRIVASDEDVVAASGRALGGRVADRSGQAWRVLAVRLLSHLPTVLAIAFGAVRIVAVTYRELTVPSDVVSPLVLRVVRGAPEAVVFILVAWLIGEAIGAVAARRIVLWGDPIPRALAQAMIATVRHPIRSAVFVTLPLLALVAVLVPSAAAAAATWRAVRATLATDAGLMPALLLVTLLVVLWAGGLLLTAVIAAWRGAVWTVAGAGTFGATGTDRQGD